MDSGTNNLKPLLTIAIPTWNRAKTLDKASNKSDKATGSKNKQADSDMLNDYKLLQYYRLFDWEDK